MSVTEEEVDRAVMTLLERGASAQSLLDILYRHGKVAYVKGGSYRVIDAPKLMRVDL